MDDDMDSMTIFASLKWIDDNEDGTMDNDDNSNHINEDVTIGTGNYTRTVMSTIMLRSIA